MKNRSCGRAPVKGGRKLKHSEKQCGMGKPSDGPTLIPVDRCGCGIGNSVPRSSPWIIYVITLAIRIHYVTQKSNWWILHPDEIFQSIEVAYSEVYGYGFRCYEYLPPLQNLTTSVDEQEYKHGMYGMRSFLFPRFFAAVFSVCRLMNVDTNPYLVARIAHIFVSSLLPVAVYYLTVKLFPCRTVALTTSIFTAFSVHLSVMGTHTLVNSFLSTFVIFAFVPILQEIASYRSETTDQKEDGSTRLQNGSISTNGHVRSNGNVDMQNHHTIKEETVHDNAKISSGGKQKYIKLFTSGLILGTACYIRIDAVSFVSVIIFTFLIIFWRKGITTKVFKLLSAISMGCFLGIVLGGLEDFHRYGIAFLSPIQWFNFNIRTNISSVLFGASPGSWYLEELLYPDLVTGIFSGLTLVGLVLTVVRESTSRADSVERAMTFAFLCSSICLLFMYSLVDHKELRFVHNVDLILVILAASSLHKLVKVGKDFLSEQQSKGVIYFVLLVYILNSFSTFPSPSTNVNSPWIYRHAQESADVNQCLDFIRHEKNVTGVVIDNSLYLTAGFTLLGQDVPLIVLVHNEYHEYNPAFVPKSKFSVDLPDRLRVMNRFSDYIYGNNVHYLTRILFKNNLYNFIVTNVMRLRSFSDLGYHVSFTSGKFAVLRRFPSKEKIREMKSYFKSMPVGKNATILEYEGSWLYTAGKYEKAIERLETAISVDSSRWRPYQLLGLSHVKLEMWTKAREVEQRCFQRHGEQRCRSLQSRVILTEEYTNFSSV